MSVVAKAVELLGFFTPQRPEIGLSEFRHLAQRDKATTYRHLCALESVGLLEQNPVNKAYRIGPAVLHLAQLREASMPRLSAVQAALPALAAATGETAHASMLEGMRLRTLAHSESTRHSTRVVMSEPVLPLHATASGLAVLAYGTPEINAAGRAAPTRYTAHTAIDATRLDAAIATARATGFGESNQGFEAGVHGIAAPLFDRTGQVAGAVAVATVAARMTPALAALIRKELRNSAQQITLNWGGVVPPALRTAWEQTLSHPIVTEPGA